MVNKRGLELSINFIVMLIIAVVIFTFAIVMAQKFFAQSNDLRGQISEQTKEQIRNMLLSQNAHVALFPESMTIERGKNEIVGVGILNTGVAAQFALAVGCRLITPAGTIEDPCPPKSINPFYNSEFVSIIKNADDVIAVNFIVDKEAPSGTYVFDIKPLRQETGSLVSKSYGFGKYKVYVTVE